MKHSLKNVIKSGWNNFKRNSYMSVAVTGVMGLVLMLLLGIISFQVLTSRLVGSLEGKLDVSVYFKSDAQDEQVTLLKKDLEKLPEVAGVVYITRDQVLINFKQDHADEPTTLQALDQLDDNPFGATLNIRARTPNDYGAISTFLENSRYREQMKDIQNNQDIIERITHLTGALRIWGLVVALVIGLIAVLITFNTIRLTIYNQKQEIEIMRLVGASNWYIRGPFIAEGAFYGTFAALISMLIFYPVLYVFSHKLSILTPGIDLFRYFVHNSWQIVLITWFGGMLLGTLSSVIAMRKHLKI